MVNYRYVVAVSSMDSIRYVTIVQQCKAALDKGEITTHNEAMAFVINKIENP